MVKVTASEAFKILIKDDKESLLEKFDKSGLVRIRDYFINSVVREVDIDECDVTDPFIKKAYINAVANGPY